MVAILAFAYTILIEPEVGKQKRTSSAILQKHSEMRAFEAQVEQDGRSRAQDPDRPERERLARLKGELAQLDARFTAEEQKFTAPAQMRARGGGLAGTQPRRVAGPR